LTSKTCDGDKIKEDKIDRACSTHWTEDKCMQNFGWKTWREETTRKTWEWMEGY